MSEYRPWAVEEVRPDEVGPDEVDLGPEQGERPEPYAPWAPGAAPLQIDPPKEKRFETPPGLGDTPPKRKGDHSHETAGAMLLWTGGFLLLGSIVWLSLMTLLIDLAVIDGDSASDIGLMRDMRGYGGWGIFASALFIIPGVGLLYHQPWARPLGYIGASVTLLLGPMGLVLGIIGLVALSRMEGA